MTDSKRSSLTPDMSRLARQELGGMSQTAVSKASGVQAYIIKQWEAGRFRPPAAALDKLRGFYEAEGVDLAAIAEHLASNAGPVTVVTPGEPALPPAGFTTNARPGFFIDESLPSEVVGRALDQMGENDDRIIGLLKQGFKTGFFSDKSEATDAAIRELFGTMAQSYLLFRMLQGRNIVAITSEQARSEPETIGDFLSQWVMQAPAAGELFKAVHGPSAEQGAKVPALAPEAVEAE